MRAPGSELTSGLRSAAGTNLGQNWFYQFSTGSVRQLREPYPPDGTPSESPFVSLSWLGTEASAGAIQYSVYGDPDSTLVAARAVPPRIVAARSRLLANPRWPSAQSVYWAVTAVNQTTGEEARGPVWRFHTMPEPAAVETIQVAVHRYGVLNLLSGGFDCGGQSLPTGAAFRAVVRFRIEDLPADLRLVGATLVLSSSDTTGIAARAPSLWGTIEDWSACYLAYPGPPSVDQSLGPLATVAISSSGSVVTYSYSGDALTSHLEATVRRRGFFGYMFLSTFGGITWLAAPADGDLRLVVRR